MPEPSGTASAPGPEGPGGDTAETAPGAPFPACGAAGAAPGAGWIVKDAVFPARAAAGVVTGVLAAVNRAVGDTAPWAGAAPYGVITAPAARAPASPVARRVRSHGVTFVTPSRW
ncbi:hypothetical protein GCM10023257_25970 [Streptomyces hyderabadensis]|uniref:Uncharacterized protein n=1 Tax=Streptomyces hyderabadensis TaxID=598549 RepID=A0ABP9I345_9ACTN